MGTDPRPLLRVRSYFSVTSSFRIFGSTTPAHVTQHERSSVRDMLPAPAAAAPVRRRGATAVRSRAAIAILGVFPPHLAPPARLILRPTSYRSRPTSSLAPSLACTARRAASGTENKLLSADSESYSPATVDPGSEDARTGLDASFEHTTSHTDRDRAADAADGHRPRAAAGRAGQCSTIAKAVVG
mgnify:CR=1 FL=1